jgi:hypothetical protein
MPLISLVLIVFNNRKALYKSKSNKDYKRS